MLTNCRSGLKGDGIKLAEGGTVTSCMEKTLHQNGSMEVVKFIDSGKRLSRPAKAELEVYSMMTWCWEQEPQKRPKFLELFKFFSENPEYSNLKELLISQDLNFQD